jgi:hypothetical protein
MEGGAGSTAAVGLHGITLAAVPTSVCVCIGVGLGPWVFGGDWPKPKSLSLSLSLAQGIKGSRITFSRTQLLSMHLLQAAGATSG